MTALFRTFDSVLETDVRVTSYKYGAGQPRVGVQITLEHNGVTLAARLPQEAARELAAAISSATEVEAPMLTAPAVPQPGNPSGLAMLAEVAADQVHRDQAGRSWYRTWSNEVTREVTELVDAGWLSTRFVDGQWLVTAAGQAALKAATRVLPADDRPRPRVAIEGNACCGGNGVEASCEVCRRD